MPQAPSRRDLWDKDLGCRVKVKGLGQSSGFIEDVGFRMQGLGLQVKDVGLSGKVRV